MSVNTNTIKVNKQAWDFFVYATLGITSKDDDEEIIKKCIRSAYLDMNRTLIIKKDINTSNTDDSNNQFYKEYCEKMYNAIEPNLSNISKAKHQCYNIFFEDGTLKKEIYDYLVTRKIKDENKRQGQPFYYGQAQKWINMTLKYLWLLGIIDEENLEIPIDSFIMEEASAKFGIELPRDNKSISYKGYSSSSTMPWSKLNKDEYERLRDELISKIGDEDSPLTWENRTWIDHANTNKR